MAYLRATCLLAAAMAITAETAYSQAEADKSRYTLFNPTPREQMRELSTDRPDTTESAYSVDAGHVQLEMSFFDYTKDASSIERVIAPMNIKVGLLNDVDLQLVLDPYITDDEEGSSAEGFGDTQLRLKINLWGNDGGDTALALMPFIQLPTASSELGTGDVQGGLIAPLLFSLPHEFGGGLMGVISYVRDESDENYALEFLHTATVSHDIAGDLGGFVEYTGIAPHDTGAGYQALLGGGLTYALDENIQPDCGLNVGLNESAPELNFFFGISIRH